MPFTHHFLSEEDYSITINFIRICNAMHWCCILSKAPVQQTLLLYEGLQHTKFIKEAKRLFVPRLQVSTQGRELFNVAEKNHSELQAKASKIQTRYKEQIFNSAGN